MTITTLSNSNMYASQCIAEYKTTLATHHTPNQQARAIDDIISAHDLIASSNFLKSPRAIIAVGPLGSQPEDLMIDRLEKQAAFGVSHLALATECICAQYLKNTYLKDLECCQSPAEVYATWQPLAQMLESSLRDRALDEGISIYASCDPLSTKTDVLLGSLKAHHYTIAILHLSVPDDIRMRSASASEEFYNSGVSFSQKTASTYFLEADECEFYYRNRTDQQATLAATWIKGFDPACQAQGSLYILDHSAYQGVVRVHNLVMQHLEESGDGACIPRWNETLEKFSSHENKQL